MRTLPALLLAAAVAVAPAACTRSPAAVHDDTQGDHAAHVDHAAHHDHAAPEISATAAPADTAPVAQMRAALAEYARRFDDADAAGHD